ncbi:hypothetical protein XENOCAPTIV_020390, partial [Xenoophorus captivus]
VHSCLSKGVAVGLGKIKLSSVSTSCINVLQNHNSSTGYASGLHQHYTEVSGGISQNDSTGFSTWLKSLKDHPDVVSYSLHPLYELMPSNSQKKGMKVAIQQYLESNVVKISPKEPSRLGVPILDTQCCPWRPQKGP